MFVLLCHQVPCASIRVCCNLATNIDVLVRRDAAITWADEQHVPFIMTSLYKGDLEGSVAALAIPLHDAYVLAIYSIKMIFMFYKRGWIPVGWDVCLRV
jgi:hypothetical protein